MAGSVSVMTDLQLPKVVLTPQETLQLLDIVRNGDQPHAGRAKEHIFLGHLRMVQLHAHRVAELTRMNRDDLFQEGCLGLGEAIEKFDPTHGTRFSTYAYIAIARRVSYGARALRRTRGVALLDDHSIADESALRAFDQVELSLTSVLDSLPQRWRQILILRYGLSGRVYTLSECATELDCSVSTASRWEQEALVGARRLLDRLSRATAA